MKEKIKINDNYIYWDGKKVSFEEFMSELFDDPDDEDCSYEAVYKKNRVE